MITKFTLDHIELVEVDGEEMNESDGIFSNSSNYTNEQIKIFNSENNTDYTNNNMFGVYFDDYIGNSRSLISGDYLLVAKDIITLPRLGCISYTVVDESGELLGTVVKVIRNQYSAEDIKENRNTKGAK